MAPEVVARTGGSNRVQAQPAGSNWVQAQPAGSNRVQAQPALRTTSRTSSTSPSTVKRTSNPANATPYRLSGSLC